MAFFPGLKRPARPRVRAAGTRRRALAAAAAALFALAAAAAWAAPPAPRVILIAPRVETGGVLGFTLEPGAGAPPRTGLRVEYGGQPIALFPDPRGKRGALAGFVGIPLTAAPGRAALTLAWEEPQGRRTARVAFEIAAGRFGEETLRVDPRHVTPSPEELARIRREAELLAAIYASGARPPLWGGGFRRPVTGEVNGLFGTRRLFNGELRSQHTGVDFRAPEGAPVRAAGGGVVRLAEELFYSGNAVVIDHGAGVFSSYAHLSAIAVAVGQRVAAGEVIGRVGATGRATGPHLHWGVKVNAVAVDPLAFLTAAAAIIGDGASSGY